MSLARLARRTIPRRWLPAARYQYERLRGLLEPELALAYAAVRPGDRVVDVGANWGVYTHALARRGAVVEAFEPQPACLATLRAYAASRPNVRVHPVGLADAAGRATLHVPLRDGRAVTPCASLRVPGLPSERIVIDVRTLDSYEFADVALIKIDVEGAELEVLRGAAATITGSRPLLLVEVEQRHHRRPIGEVFCAITSLGYDGAFLDPDAGLRPLSEFDPAEQQASTDAEQPRAVHINNFLFSPADSLARAWPKSTETSRWLR